MSRLASIVTGFLLMSASSLSSDDRGLERQPDQMQGTPSGAQYDTRVQVAPFSHNEAKNFTARDDTPQAPPPPCVWQDFMYFNDFPSDEHEYAVIAAFINTLRLASAGAKAIQDLQAGNPTAGSPSSFLRYFTGLDH